MAKNTSLYINRTDLQTLITVLRDDGYRCIGPQVRDGAIVYETLENCSQLPQGVSQYQSPGQYTLKQEGGQRYFAWANGPQAIKTYVFASREFMWRSEQSEDGQLRFVDMASEPEATAIIGVRACDLAALYIQDKHFLHGENKDPYYLARRQQTLLVAVNCTHAAETCFCVSTGDGPKAEYGYDIVLSELDDG
ncbi:MAG: sulfite reductase subunit A, partial [Gammaproteobacteria bacterium]